MDNLSHFWCVGYRLINGLIYAEPALRLIQRLCINIQCGEVELFQFII